MSDTQDQKRGWFSRLTQGLTRSSAQMTQSVVEVFTKVRLDQDALDRLEDLLIEADLGPQAAVRVAEAFGKARFGREASENEIRESLAEAIASELAPHEGRFEPLGGPKPYVVLFVGVNGSGKTTTCAKLAWRLKEDGRSVVIAAADTFRAAAIEQLQSWAARLQLELISSHTGADSAAVAFDAWQAAKARGRDYLIIDTAGRLHTKSNLMEELAKIRRVLQKHDPSAPQHRWLVVDGSLGANSIEQAKVFHQSFGLTGIIVTKLDGTSRGGALVGIYRQLRIPIYFLGLGEQPEDLQPFSIDNYAKAVFGLDAP